MMRITDKDYAGYRSDDYEFETGWWGGGGKAEPLIEGSRRDLKRGIIPTPNWERKCRLIDLIRCLWYQPQLLDYQHLNIRYTLYINHYQSRAGKSKTDLRCALILHSTYFQKGRKTEIENKLHLRYLTYGRIKVQNEMGLSSREAMSTH